MISFELRGETFGLGAEVLLDDRDRRDNGSEDVLRDVRGGVRSRLRGELDREAEAVGVVVVADGAHTLTPPAPGGYDPDAIPVQAALDDALAAGDTDALTQLPGAVVGRAAYQVLAGLGAPRSAKELYRGAPYGVGYFAGVWHP